MNIIVIIIDYIIVLTREEELKDPILKVQFDYKPIKRDEDVILNIIVSSTTIVIPRKLLARLFQFFKKSIDDKNIWFHSFDIQLI